MWFAINLYKDYQRNYYISVRFVNLPDNKILLNKKDSCINFVLKTNGINHLMYYFSNKNKIIEVNFSSLALKRQNENLYYYNFNLSKYKDSISKTYDITSNAIFFTADTLELIFSEISFKKVPVKLNAKLNFVSQYDIYENIKISPDSIIVKGDEKILKNINYLETQYKEMSDIDKNTTFDISIKNYSYKNIEVKNKTINVSFKVEKFSEIEFDIPLRVNYQNNKIKTFPDIVKVKVLVAIKDFNKINKDLFVINAIPSNELNSKKLRLKITKTPPLVKIISIYPETVEYIILK